MSDARVCAYCCLDHEIHGGCFTGKKPSELRAEMFARLAAADISNENDRGREEIPLSLILRGGGSDG